MRTTASNMKKLLGISLALVMLIGSVPLGYSEPLRVQLEQGIETDQIQCNNPNYVLVQRTNGKMACVTERTAEKTGWEIIDNNETPIYGVNANGEPSHSSGYTATLSKLPQLGETVTFSFEIDNRNLNGITNVSNESIGFGFKEGWEFVEVSPSKVTQNTVNGDYKYEQLIQDSVNVNTLAVIGEKDANGYWISTSESRQLDHPSTTFEVKVKPTKVGLNTLWVGHIPHFVNQYITVFVGNDKTISLEQYYNENPQETPEAKSLAAQQLEQEQKICTNAECEPEPKEKPTCGSDMKLIDGICN